MTEEQAIRDTKQFSKRMVDGNNLLKPGHDPVMCNVLPNSPICNMASHGFICHFPDGTCLKHQNPETEEIHD